MAVLVTYQHFETVPILQLVTFSSISRRFTFFKGTARSQKWLVLQATSAHQTMSHWLLFAKNRMSSKSSWL